MKSPKNNFLKVEKSVIYKTINNNKKKNLL